MLSHDKNSAFSTTTHAQQALQTFDPKFRVFFCASGDHTKRLSTPYQAGVTLIDSLTPESDNILLPLNSIQVTTCPTPAQYPRVSPPGVSAPRSHLSQYLLDETVMDLEEPSRRQKYTRADSRPTRATTAVTSAIRSSVGVLPSDEW